MQLATVAKQSYLNYRVNLSRVLTCHGFAYKERSVQVNDDLYLLCIPFILHGYRIDVRGQKGKAIGVDPAKHPEPNVQYSMNAHLQHLVLLVVENSQYRTFDAGDKGASPYGYCRDMPT